MSATSAFPLATETAYAGGDPGGVAGSDDTGGDTGAAGPSSDGGAYLSTGALAAILVIVCLVAVFGGMFTHLQLHSTHSAVDTYTQSTHMLQSSLSTQSAVYTLHPISQLVNSC